MTAQATLTPTIRTTTPPRQVRRVARSDPRIAIAWAAVSIAAGLWFADWLPAAALAVLWLGWTLLGRYESLLVLPLAFTYQWAQACFGIFYYGLTGRTSPTLRSLDYRPIVIVELVGLVVLAVGMALGTRVVGVKRTSREREMDVTSRTLIVAYAIAAVVCTFLGVVAWQFPRLTQLIIALSFLRMAVVYVLLRSFVIPRPRWIPFAMLLATEIILTSTSYFADFRQPLAMAGLALLEARARRSRAGRQRMTIAFGLVACVACVMSLMWTAVKFDYRLALRENRLSSRTEELDFITRRAAEWIDSPEEWLPTTDRFVDRVWQIYFPGLTLARVPSIVPHSNGALLEDAVLRVLMPRIFFPEKSGMRNDSEKVRLYAGVYVAGSESGTSYALGYTAESYVDFGIPWMYVPVFLYAALVAGTVVWLYRKLIHVEIAVSTAAVIALLSLQSLESSWAYMLGQAVALSVVLGATSLIVDRLLLRRTDRAAANRRRAAVRPVYGR